MDAYRLGFTLGTTVINLLIIGIILFVLVLVIITLLLGIKALKIYIKKNKSE